MSMPWHVDALLPTGPRYASMKFRRVARHFDAAKMGFGDACELVAFLGVCPIPFARRIFHWQPHAVRQAELLLGHPPVVEGAAPLLRENLELQDANDGIVMLDALIDGGWHQGAVPPVVRLAVASLRDSGWSHSDVAARFGVTKDQARALAGRTFRRADRSAVAGLGFSGNPVAS